MNKRSSGFTVIEAIVVAFILGLASILFFVQKNSIEVAARDDQRKTAINAMYYSLEKVFFTKNKYYPAELNSDTLPSVDPDLFTDPNGYLIGEADSDYRYEPTGCSGGKCTGYTLRADLETEDDYTKTN